MGELGITLRHLSLEQHLLAGVFLLGYGAALGSMFSPAGRLRAALLALIAAAGFAALTHPWEHGVMLVGLAIGGLALFIALAWAIGTVGAGRESAQRAVAARSGHRTAPGLEVSYTPLR